MRSCDTVVTLWHTLHRAGMPVAGERDFDTAAGLRREGSRCRRPAGTLPPQSVLLRCLLGALLSASPAASHGGAGAHVGGPPLVVVIPTFSLAFTSRVLPGRTTWRERVPTVITTDGPEERGVPHPQEKWNATGHEAWFEYPDDGEGEVHKLGRQSDTRCIAALRIANDTHPRAHWYLYGDDDTQWFPETILPLLRRFDHTRPYILSDSTGCSAGRCRHTRKSALCVHGSARLNVTAGCVRFPSADPCTREALTSPTLCPGYGYGPHDKPAHQPFPDLCGTSGMIISRGLMDRISRADFLQNCEHGQLHPPGIGGDLRLMFCVWTLLGIGPTDPLFWAHGDDFCSFGYLRPQQIVEELDRALTRGDCGFNCQRVLQATAAYSSSHGPATIQDVWKRYSAARTLFADMLRRHEDEQASLGVFPPEPPPEPPSFPPGHRWAFPPPPRAPLGPTPPYPPYPDEAGEKQ